MPDETSAVNKSDLVGGVDRSSSERKEQFTNYHGTLRKCLMLLGVTSWIFVFREFKFEVPFEIGHDWYLFYFTLLWETVGRGG